MENGTRAGALSVSTVSSQLTQNVQKQKQNKNEE